MHVFNSYLINYLLQFCDELAENVLRMQSIPLLIMLDTETNDKFVKANSANDLRTTGRDGQRSPEAWLRIAWQDGAQDHAGSKHAGSRTW